MRKTKILTVIIASVLSISLVAGCGKKTDSAVNGTDQTKKQSITLKFAFPGDPPKAQDEVNKALEDKMSKDGLNYKLNFTFIPWDQYWNKLALIAAGGEDYDITWTHISQIPDLVAKKALAPLDEALKSATNLKKIVPDYVLKEGTIDGKVYAISRVVPMAEYRNFLSIRGDLRKKYNIPEIKTLSDLESYFAAIQKNEPNMYVLAADTGDVLYREYCDYYFPIGDNDQYPVYIDPTDSSHKVKSFIESDGFKKLANKRYEWAAKGYIPKDISKLTDAEAGFLSGKVAATWDQVLKMTERVDGLKKNLPDASLEDVFLNPDKPKYIYSAADNMLSVFASSKHVKEAVSFIDWTKASQNNFDLWSYGIKDTNYKLDGNSVVTDGIAPEHSYVPINWAWNDSQLNRFSKNVPQSKIDQIKKWDSDGIKTPFVGFKVNQANIKTEIAQVNAVWGEYYGDLMNGKTEYDKVSPNFIKKLKDSGLDKIIAETQKQLDAYISSQK